MNKKKCTYCTLYKDADKDFYVCKGRARSECKRCTVRKNVRYQRKTESWRNRTVDPEEKRQYMKEYYAKNKEKYAQYRKQFKEKNPEYYKMYSRKRKDEQRGKK